MSTRKGTISVDTSDILPIIKKWLYSEHDIFLRELISNCTDAIYKRATLGRSQNVEVPNGEITIEVDKKNKKIMIHDNGLGMSEEEIEKYLAKLAFSGAQEFVDKMKELKADSKEDIIGKFGLGFYSVFMVVDKVEVDSLSYVEGAKSTKWTSQGSIEYTFEDSKKDTVGTTVTLHINEDSKEFLETYSISSVLRKYCDFMPYPIYIKDLEEKKEKKDKKDKKEKEEIEEAKISINNTEPIWKKDPTTLKDQDYIDFYKKQFPLDPDPLFWIHLKIDHPFELLGVLYFPKLNPQKPINEQNIRLYAKQVFVSDSIKNIIPEFLALLKGYIDSSDIPLNVSRSSLQGDPNIKKISNYIIKKVSDSLKKLFRSDRKRYVEIWEDIGLFIKYGCISDEKFDENMREFVLFKNTDEKYLTLSEYKEAIPADFKEKLKEKVLYSEKGKTDVFLRKQLAQDKIPSIETDSIIDPHFMQHVEMKSASSSDKLQFKAVGQEIENLFTVEKSTDEHKNIQKIFKELLIGPLKKDEKGKEIEGDLQIEIKAFKDSKTPAYYKIDEHMKRLQQMTRTMGQAGSNFPLKKTLVINPLHSLVQNILKIWEQGEHKELVSELCKHIEDLALISSEGIDTVIEKDQFIFRSQELIDKLSRFVV